MHTKKEAAKRNALKQGVLAVVIALIAVTHSTDSAAGETLIFRGDENYPPYE